MHQNSLKLWLTLSIALALLITTVPATHASETSLESEEVQKNLTPSSPLTPDLVKEQNAQHPNALLSLQTGVTDAVKEDEKGQESATPSNSPILKTEHDRNQEMVTIGYHNWFQYLVTQEIPRSEYENRENFEKNYQGYFLVKKTPVIEKQPEETVKIQYKGWFGSSVREIPKSLFNDTERFNKEYPHYVLAIDEKGGASPTANGDVGEKVNTEASAQIPEEVTVSGPTEISVKPKVKVEKLVKALSEAEDELTWSELSRMIDKIVEQKKAETSSTSNAGSVQTIAHNQDHKNTDKQ